MTFFGYYAVTIPAFLLFARKFGELPTAKQIQREFWHGGQQPRGEAIELSTHACPDDSSRSVSLGPVPKSLRRAPRSDDGGIEETIEQNNMSIKSQKAIKRVKL